MTENNDDQQPKSYSEHDNYFEQNRYPVQSNMNANTNLDEAVDNETLNDTNPAPQQEVDNRQSKDDTEFAAETAVFNPSENDPELLRKKEQETRMQENVEAGWGWVALVISLLSFFVWPLIFAIAGSALGIYAKRRGANTLGNIAIGLAIASVTLWLIIYPII